MIYQPKGSMCATCVHRTRRCDHLQFETMAPIKRWPDGLVIVRCREYERDFRLKGSSL